MSENVVQPGVEPGSPDYRSDALTTRPLNQPRWQRGYFKALSVAGSWETLFTHNAWPNYRSSGGVER